MRWPVLREIGLLELRRIARSWKYWAAVLFPVWIAAYPSVRYEATKLLPLFWAPAYLLFLPLLTLAVTSPIYASDSLGPWLCSRPVSTRQVFMGRVGAHFLLGAATWSILLLGSAFVPGALASSRTTTEYSQVWTARKNGVALDFASAEARSCDRLWRDTVQQKPSQCRVGDLDAIKLFEEQPHPLFIDSSRKECLDRWKSDAEAHTDACALHGMRFFNRGGLLWSREGVSHPPLELPSDRCLRSILQSSPQSVECTEFAEFLQSASSGSTPARRGAEWALSSEDQVCVDWERKSADALKSCESAVYATSARMPPPGLMLALLWFGSVLFWSIVALGWQPVSEARWALGSLALLFVGCGFPLTFLIMNDPEQPWTFAKMGPLQGSLSIALVPYVLAGVAYYAGSSAWTSGELAAGPVSVRSGWGRWGWAFGILGFLAVLIVTVLVLAHGFSR
jgi:hypothetical protein